MSAVLQIKSQEKRVCKSCAESKALTDFSFHKQNNAYTHKCKDCHVKSERKRQKDLWEKEEYRDYHNAKGRAHRLETNWKDKRTLKDRPDRLKRLYGIDSFEHVLKVLEEQNGLCANTGCCKEISLDVRGTAKNRAVIDHDHATGKFRALLCVRCNLILGTLETKQKKIQGLMEYLSKHN